MQQIRCDQCGRLLTPSEVRAGICPSCGRAISAPAEMAATDTLPTSAPADDDSQTRPMPALAPMPAPASSSPEAPPTAPPPPPEEALTAPAAPVAEYRPPPRPRATPDANQAPAVASPASADDRTAAMTPHLAPDASAAPVAAAPTGAERNGRAKQSRLGWVSALALLIVLVIGSTGALLAANGQLGALLGTPPSPTATASPTAGPPPAPAGFTRYTAPDFTIVYPSGWVKAPQPSGLVLFTNPGVRANFLVQTFSQVTDPGNLNDSFISGLGPTLLNGAQGKTAISHKTTPATAPLAGTLWTRTEADVAVTSGGKTVTWHVVSLAVAHNQRMYLVSYFATADAFGAQDSAFFEPMTKSLLLVSSQP